VPPRDNVTPPGKREAPLLFYDGDCGVCHLCVRFVLWADPGGEVRFAPLGGGTFQRRIPAALRETLPDSLVLVTTDGRVLTRSAAVLSLLGGMSGIWRLVGRMGALLPRSLADALYDGMARIRRRLAPRPSGVCPVVPAPERARFDV
jgi:predicted DCC family thiol-disulfide oxidoreductase YuxK